VVKAEAESTRAQIVMQTDLLEKKTNQQIGEINDRIRYLGDQAKAESSSYEAQKRNEINE